MLVLSRKPSETIVLTVPPSTAPTRIEVTLIDIRSGHRARLGVTAPREVEVHRLEVQEAIDRERGAA